MCSDAKREGIQYRVGHPIPFRDQEGNLGTAPWWGSARSETLSEVLSAPGVSWEHVDVPADSFRERTVSNKQRLVEFPVPAGKVLGGVLVRREAPGQPPKIGVNIVTRPITPGERAYALSQGVKDPNPRMPTLRDPLHPGSA